MDDLKILTWNIYMLPYCSILYKNKKRAKSIAQEIAYSDYHIIVFQEAFDHIARNVIQRKLGRIFPYAYGPANESTFSLRVNSGIWILSRIPLTKIKEIEFKSRFGIDSVARKGAVLFEGEWKGKLFQLIGTHLQADSPDIIRFNQCREIANRLLKEYSKDNVPQILCGDFNIEYDDTENYQSMIRILGAQQVCLETDIHVTYDEINNRLAKRINGKKRILDYILVCNSKLIKTIKRRTAIYKTSYKNRIMDLSDHYGVEAQIIFS